MLVVIARNVVTVITRYVSCRGREFQVEAATDLPGAPVSDSRRPVFALVTGLDVPLEVVFRGHPVHPEELSGQHLPLIRAPEPPTRLDAHFPHLETVFPIVGTPAPLREHVFHGNREFIADRDLYLEIESGYQVIEQICFQGDDGFPVRGRQEYRCHS